MPSNDAGNLKVTWNYGRRGGGEWIQERDPADALLAWRDKYMAQEKSDATTGEADPQMVPRL